MSPGAASRFLLVRSASAGSREVLGPSSPYGYSWVLVLLFIPYLFSLRTWARSGPPISLRRLCILIALVWAPLVVVPPVQSHDVYQYVFYARMELEHGANPYAVSPTRFSGDPWFEAVPWPRRVSVYGPLWSMAMATLVRAAPRSIEGAVVLAKAFAAVLGAVTLMGLVSLSRAERGTGRAIDPSRAIALFGLNPLVVTSVALGAHADVALAAAIVWAMVWERRGRPLLSAVLLTGGALVKLYAVIPLLAFLLVRWRRDGFRATLAPAIACVVFAGAAFAPYWSGGAPVRGLLDVAWSSSSSLAGLIQRWVVDGLEALGAEGAGPVVATGVRVVGVTGIVIAIWTGVRRAEAPDATWHVSLLALSVFVLVTPWFLPWYLMMPLALAATRHPADALARAVVVFSGSCVTTVAGAGGLPVLLARYAPPLLVLGREGHHRPVRSSGSVGHPRGPAPRDARSWGSSDEDSDAIGAPLRRAGIGVST
jgi:glycosyl transferase family 87